MKWAWLNDLHGCGPKPHDTHLKYKVCARCIQDLYRPPQTWPSSGRLGGVTVGGSHSNNIEKLQWGCSNLAAPSSSSPKWDLPSSELLDLAHWIENMCACGAPLLVVRRPYGRDFLRWRISEMKSSANPAPCAPGSHGPPAYCDSLRSASSSRTLQLTLGQPRS